MISMLGVGIIVPLLPFYARSFHAPGWQIALLFSAYPAGTFFGEPFWGRLSDRIGRRPLLISTVCANCLCYLALAFAPNVAIGCLVRFMGGFAGGNGSVVSSYVADVTPVAYRSGRMAILGAAYNVGFIFGPGLGGLLARPGEGPTGYQLPMLVASGAAAVAATGVFLLVRESRTHADRSRPQGSRWAAAGQAFRHPVVGRLMILTFIAGLAFNGIESVFGFWSSTPLPLDARLRRRLLHGRGGGGGRRPGAADRRPVTALRPGAHAGVRHRHRRALPAGAAVLTRRRGDDLP